MTLTPDELKRILKESKKLTEKSKKDFDAAYKRVMKNTQNILDVL